MICVLRSSLNFRLGREDAVWRSRLRLEETRHLPACEQPARRTKTRNVVNKAQAESMRAIEVRYSTIGLEITQVTLHYETRVGNIRFARTRRASRIRRAGIDRLGPRVRRIEVQATR